MRQTEVVRKIKNHIRNCLNDTLNNSHVLFKYNREEVTIPSTEYTKIIGTSFGEYILYLEKLFDKTMTWQNYGKLWCIDHIIPRSLFKINKENGEIDWDELYKAFNYKNTKPMDLYKNSLKRNMTEEEFKIYERRLTNGRNRCKWMLRR